MQQSHVVVEDIFITYAKKIVLSLTLFTMRLPSDLWFNQMLLLAWLAEEEDDDENERLYNQLNGEGRCRRDRHLRML
jgi:hypothetical protein